MNVDVVTSFTHSVIRQAWRTLIAVKVPGADLANRLPRGWTPSPALAHLHLILIIALAAAMIVFAPTQGAAAQKDQVWLAPVSDSADLLDLFKQPNRWTRARSQIAILKFGTDTPHALNNPSPFAQANAFRLLHSWGIDLAIDAPAIKEWDCQGTKAADHTLRTIAGAEALGATVKYVSMDEPMRSGTRPCHLSLQETAARTAAYVRTLKARYPALEIGDIEAYPYDRIPRLEEWIAALRNEGYRPAHFHLDASVHYLDIHREITVTADLRSLSTFLKSQDIPLGIIFWSGYDPEPSDRQFFDRTMAWVRTVGSAIGTPPHAIFQSWVVRSYEGCADTDDRCIPPRLKCPAGADGCGLRNMPVNLPDNDPQVYSLTRLVIQALDVLRSNRSH